MSQTYREIVCIDEKKCDGCGVCIPSCKEGALQIVNGKARLVSEVYCDGLGACLGTCPRGAITIERREAEAFDEEAVAKRGDEGRTDLPCGCPGMMAKSMAPKASPEKRGDDIQSQLSHWPIQLKLIPANAPYLRDAKLLLLADCAAVAYANLHRDLVAGHVVAMACPKLDDASAHIEKLARVISEGGPRSIDIIMMEVPCCGGLSAIAREALRRSGRHIEVQEVVIGLDGEK